MAKKNLEKKNINKQDINDKDCDKGGIIDESLDKSISDDTTDSVNDISSNDSDVKDVSKMTARERSNANLISFADLTPEDRKEMGRKSAAAKRRKKEQRMKLHTAMSELLDKDVVDDAQISLLRRLGYDDDEMINSVLLMAALFTRGASGDVYAISKIIDMQKELDEANGAGNSSQSVVINVNATGSSHTMSQDEEDAIYQAESGNAVIDDNDDWDVDDCTRCDDDSNWDDEDWDI